MSIFQSNYLPMETQVNVETEYNVNTLDELSQAPSTDLKETTLESEFEDQKSTSASETTSNGLNRKTLRI